MLGEMLFTHFGLSGPLVLSLSSDMIGNIKDFSLELDLKPALAQNSWMLGFKEISLNIRIRILEMLWGIYCHPK